MNRPSLLLLALCALAAPALAAPPPQGGPPSAGVYPVQEGFVDAGGVLIYYQSLGRGEPLVVLHGGPGASHDYFLPYLLPLMRHHRLIFIDERGSGRSEALEDPAGYTVEAMVEDVEAVRRQLKLGKIDLLGHSYGGVLAQAYALKYQGNLAHLVLCSTFSSTRAMNEVFVRMKEKMAPELHERIDKLEAAGLFGHGKDFEKNRYPSDYMTAAWGEGYFPYLYQSRPDPNYDPAASGTIPWDLYREMWGSHGEFIIDGNLKSVEYTDRLATLHVPTLITAGDHDECDPSLSRTMHERIAGSQLVVLPGSGHMTFVDQPNLFVSTVDGFLRGLKAEAPARQAGTCKTNQQCPPNEFCAKLYDSCEDRGKCEERPTDCTERGKVLMRPVCGCDSKTYDNACLAAAAGVSVKNEGQCTP